MNILPYVIFLNPSVLMDTIYPEEVFKKAEELFPNVYKDTCNKHQYRCALSHFLNVEAVNNLDYLISEMQKTRTIWIVMASDWTNNCSYEEESLDGYIDIFKNHKFSKYIVEKIPEKISKNEAPTYCKSPDHLNSYSNEVCKASRIQYWLERNLVNGYCILDFWKDSYVSHHSGYQFGKRYFKIDLLDKDTTTKILNQ